MSRRERLVVALVFIAFSFLAVIPQGRTGPTDGKAANGSGLNDRKLVAHGTEAIGNPISVGAVHFWPEAHDGHGFILAPDSR